MSFSDICFDKLADLRDGFLSYLDWDYSNEDLSHVVDAMYSLADFAGRQQFVDPPSGDQLAIGADRSVIESLLEHVAPNRRDQICNVLAKVMQCNPRLNAGVLRLLDEANQKNSLFKTIADPTMLLMLKQVLKNKEASL